MKRTIVAVRSISLAVMGALLPVSGCGKTATPAAEEPEAPMPTSDGASAASSEQAPTALNAGQCPSRPLLDDLEDGDHQIIEAESRGGYWYTFADPSGSKVEPSGSFSPSKGGAESSKYGARMTGKTAASGVVYAGMGFTLSEPKGPFDASCCQGVSFRAKAVRPGTNRVLFKIADWQTVPEGGLCGDACYNDFGKELTLGEDWRRFTVDFDETRQEPGWGLLRDRLDSGRIYQLNWQVKEPDSEFEVWVDDVEFVGCEP